ncbi:MAG: aminotransferase class V-fold PLP-dependent enzyme, partial [candidate division Zixibacteria bacterium]|nr:aminotransferase class V-fold PLP-dependent enzyme [candidate division Zixibacteria bacterium]
YNELPWKFEAGTPNIADVVAFGSAIDYLTDLGMDNIRDHEKELTEYIINRLREIPSISIIGPTDLKRRGGAISFTDKDIHPHDIAHFLDSKGIAVRAGHHCAQPLMRALGLVATTRASLYIYNSKSDVDSLIDALLEMRDFFKA